MITIITRCTRVENILQVKKSIPIKYKWIILFDINKIISIDPQILFNLSDENIEFFFLKGDKNFWGMDMINEILPKVKTRWIYFLDDDNVLHPDFIDEKYLKTSKKVIAFDQFINGKDFSKLEYRIASPENMKVSKVDFSQVIFDKSIIGTFNFNYVSDGEKIQSLFEENPKSFLFINKTLCYYNFLKKSHDSSPKILVISNDIIELESKKVSDYESTKLNSIMEPNDYNIDKIISIYNPDAIITKSNSVDEHSNLNIKSFNIRKRWLHTNRIDENIGESAYQCANNFILTGDDTLVSVVTPVFNTKDKLYRTYQSLKSQTYGNWEWIIVNDSDDRVTLNICKELRNFDCRVKLYSFEEKSKGIIGESKYRAFSLASGKWIVELDHDDFLLENALFYVVKAFNTYKGSKFVYSDCAETFEDNTPIFYGDIFAFGYGSYRKEMYKNMEYLVINSPNINPKTIRHIVGSPNHLRAWDRSFYNSIGGHNRRLSIADDYELMVRTFLNTTMVRIPKFLYIQYYHDNNTQNMTRSDIQRRVRSISNFYNEKIKIRFNELGFEDWAYLNNKQNPLMTESKFGQEENFVNYIYKENIYLK